MLLHDRQFGKSVTSWSPPSMPVQPCALSCCFSLVSAIFHVPRELTYSNFLDSHWRVSLKFTEKTKINKRDFHQPFLPYFLVCIIFSFFSEIIEVCFSFPQGLIFSTGAVSPYPLSKPFSYQRQSFKRFPLFPIPSVFPFHLIRFH